MGQVTKCALRLGVRRGAKTRGEASSISSYQGGVAKEKRSGGPGEEAVPLSEPHFEVDEMRRLQGGEKIQKVAGKWAEKREGLKVRKWGRACRNNKAH